MITFMANTELLSFSDLKGEIVGRLYIREDNSLFFDGNTEESATIFFNALIAFMNPYINSLWETQYKNKVASIDRIIDESVQKKLAEIISKRMDDLYKCNLINI